MLWLRERPGASGKWSLPFCVMILAFRKSAPWTCARHYKHPKFRFFPFDMRQSVQRRPSSAPIPVIHLAFAIAQWHHDARRYAGKQRRWHDQRVSRGGRRRRQKSHQPFQRFRLRSGEGLTEATPVAPSSRFPLRPPQSRNRAQVQVGIPPHGLRASSGHIHFWTPGALLLLRKMCTGPFYISPPPPHPRVQIVTRTT